MMNSKKENGNILFFYGFNCLAGYVIRGYTGLIAQLHSSKSHLCLVLKHNFFADIACQLPPDFTSNASETDAEKQIAMLEEELIKLRAERDLLKRMVAEK